MKGSEHNDAFTFKDKIDSKLSKKPNNANKEESKIEIPDLKELTTKTNHSGGTLGGISCGQNIVKSIF